MKKFKNVFLALFVTALTSLNLVLPAYAEETTTPTVDSAGFSVSVVGDGTVTLSSGDFTKSLSNGDIFNADYEEGTEIKIVSKSDENAVIDDVTLNNMVMSVDPEARPELVAMLGAAISTCISDIPFDGPCAMTQVGMVDGEFIINPSQVQW